jgi:hypothetical protein
MIGPMVVVVSHKATMSREGNVWVIAFDEAEYGVFRATGVVASEALRLAEEHVSRVDAKGKRP